MKELKGRVEWFWRCMLKFEDMCLCESSCLVLLKFRFDMFESFVLVCF